MLRNKYRRYTCMNNQNNFNQDVIETSCKNSCFDNCYMTNQNCECGFDEEYNVFPENPMLAQSYVPIQYMDKTFIPQVGLKMGTIFPELVSPYMPGDSMRQIEFIKRTNTIGEGCNK